MPCFRSVRIGLLSHHRGRDSRRAVAKVRTRTRETGMTRHWVSLSTLGAMLHEGRSVIIRRVSFRMFLTEPLCHASVSMATDALKFSVGLFNSSSFHTVAFLCCYSWRVNRVYVGENLRGNSTSSQECRRLGCGAVWLLLEPTFRVNLSC
jgi:hypothetical protein